MQTESDVMSAEEIAELRASLIAEAAAETAPVVKAKPVRKSTANVNVVPVKRGGHKGNTAVNPDSIRQFLRGRLIAGATTDELKVELAERYPDKQASARATVHIGYYRSQLRKEGLLPPVKRVLAVTAPK